MTARRRWLGIAAVLTGLAACSKTPDNPPAPSDLPRFELASGESAKHGERLSKVLGCTGCHNDALTGNDWSEPGYGTLWSANLTRSAERWSDAELTQMIVAGKRPDRALIEMPSALFTQLHPDDVAALVTYLKALKPVGPVHPDLTFGPLLQEEIEAGEYKNSVQEVAEEAGKGPPDLGAKFAFGRFIVRATCAECHGIDLTGSKEPMEDDGNAPPNLRIVGSYSTEHFAMLMRSGKAAGDREVGLMSKVARRRYANFTDGEVGAVRAYLTELAQRDP